MFKKNKMLKKINKINIVFIIFCFLFLNTSFVNATSVYQMGVSGTDLYFSSTPGDSSTAAFYIKSATNNIGIGMGNTTPTAKLHIAAGSATAGTAPLKLTSGTLMSTPEAGAIEFDGTHYYVTIGTTRYQLDQQASSSNIMDVNTLRASTAVITPNVYGSEVAYGDLTLSSTLNAYKDKIFFGSAQTSVYDELNGRLGIGTASPAYNLDVNGTLRATGNISQDRAMYIKDFNGTTDSWWGWYAWDKEFQFNKRDSSNLFVNNVFTANWDTSNFNIAYGSLGVNVSSPT